MKIDLEMINEVLDAEIEWHSTHAPETKVTLKERRAFVRGLIHAQRIIGKTSEILKKQK